MYNPCCLSVGYRDIGNAMHKCIIIIIISVDC